MRSLTPCNDDWVFHDGFDPALQAQWRAGEPVRLPHTAVELPFSYFDERSYQRPFAYQKRLRADPAWADREVSLQFDGAMADAEVFLNGEPVGAHRDGYTPFEARLTGRLRPGDNLVTVRIDGSENPEIPPFGGQIDYLTYAGIYRDVWLKVTARSFISGVKIETPDVLAPTKRVTAQVALTLARGEPPSGTLRATLRDGSGAVLASTSAPVAGDNVALALDGLLGIALWEPLDPRLYTLALELETPLGTDAIEQRFGFRSVEFSPGGFRLNGVPLKLRGLNRHQSFPYRGYALGRRAQERDAEILRFELGCNIVRTSHYPQSPWFLDHCDRIGLLVFEEIPGWQHIGGAGWKREAVENVRRMITRDWNHPAIVIWGVRINESGDDHDFYSETNRLARALDTTRPTGGVRYITESELLEDVYTMNDFILGNEELGGNRARTALRPQREVTGLERTVPYLITEFGGHMYPTKAFDQEQRQAEHVRRHLEVLDAAYGDPEIAGAIGWCAFDYNTHRDFGSGDRICYHGVADMFREPKWAASVYASQLDPAERVVLTPVTVWARGERNIGGILPLLVLTNCDEIELVYGNNPPKRFAPDRDAFPHLPHAPVLIERRHFTDEELGRWGMRWEDGTLVGYLEGKPVATRRFVADPVPTTLALVPDSTELEGPGDAVRVIVRALDQAGNKLPFFFDPAEIAVTGPARLLGPELVPFRGGSLGFWVEATGEPGAVTLSVSTLRLGTATATLAARADRRERA